MKRCWKCKQERSEEEYPFRNKSRGTRQNTCKYCVRENSKEWFKNNRERAYKNSRDSHRRWSQQRKRELTEIVNKIKAAPCTDCNQKYNPWVMQYDHLDARTKRDNVASMIHAVLSLEAILEEIHKCELVCANCHAERTYRRRTETK